MGKNRDAFNIDVMEKQVLNYFMHIFINQVGIPEDETHESEIRCLDPEASGSEHTYELHIKGKKIRSRRMALSPLGENSGSKSICFKVIYNDLLVVKIPPVPIEDFDEYIRQINKERRIARQLQPTITAIAPSISAILKRLPRFAPKKEQNADLLEQKYVQLLRKKSWLQEHLKLNDAFGFFMNLSQYSFLSYVMEQMHDIKSRLHDETFGQFDILWNLMAFEEMFGSRNSATFFDINEIYTEYEDAVNELLRKNGVQAHAFMFKRKEWFLLFLARKNNISGESGLPEGFDRHLLLLFQKIEKEHSSKITGYRQMMHNYVSDKMFMQNRTQFKSIILNMLELLYRLRKRKVVIRDLKPDNIFVMCNSFVDKTNQFLLGLIDFETAIIITPGKKIEQPPLAGTPSYATPSHMVKNNIIDKALGDLERVLYFQDWHAVICMMFASVTGERLFLSSRVWVSETWRIMHKARQLKKSPMAAFKQCSRLFWQSAAGEFEQKIDKYQAILKNIVIDIPETIAEIFKTELVADKNLSIRRGRKLILSQQFFKGEKSCQDLLQSSHFVVRKCRMNWEKGVNIPEVTPEIRSRIIFFFRQLEYNKLEVKNRNATLRQFDTASLSLSLYDILMLMFQMVSNAMYRKEWDVLPDVVPLAVNRKKETAVKDSHEETVAYEETLAYDGQSGEFEESETHEKTISMDDASDKGLS